jgi:hypothetical protein
MKPKLLSVIIISGLLICVNKLLACPPPPPIAILSGTPSETFVGDTITLDGSGSQPVCSYINKYEWDFHYDESFNVERDTGYTSFTSYSYSAPGTYTIALRVRNSCGYYSVITSQCLFTVTVIDVVFVDENATGSNDGSSWINAFNHLKDALDAADSDDEIWVAQGIYKPDQNTSNPSGTDDRTTTFQLKNKVAIYGGFPTGGGPLSSRDWGNNATILSGDIGTEGVNNDNSYNVIMGASDIIIDGFTIANGYSNEWTERGAGIYNTGDNVAIFNCKFMDNYATRCGAGILNSGDIKTITSAVSKKLV